MNLITKYRRREPLTIKVTLSRVVFVIMCGLLIAACGAAIADNPIDVEQKQQDQISSHILSVQGLPAWPGKSHIRENLTEIEHAEFVGAQSTSFFCGPMGCNKANPPIFECPSIGAPIQVTDQLSNPDQPVRDNSEPLENGGGNVTIKNMDPNGIYQGDSTGTYVQCIESGGAVVPTYWEGFVLSAFSPAKWDESTGKMELTGPPSFQFTK